MRIASPGGAFAPENEIRRERVTAHQGLPSGDNDVMPVRRAASLALPAFAVAALAASVLTSPVASATTTTTPTASVPRTDVPAPDVNTNERVMAWVGLTGATPGIKGIEDAQGLSE